MLQLRRRSGMRCCHIRLLLPLVRRQLRSLLRCRTDSHRLTGARSQPLHSARDFKHLRGLRRRRRLLLHRRARVRPLGCTRVCGLCRVRLCARRRGCSGRPSLFQRLLQMRSLCSSTPAACLLRGCRGSCRRWCRRGRCNRRRHLGLRIARHQSLIWRVRRWNRRCCCAAWRVQRRTRWA